jgi:Amt family ammonium transporter
VSALVLAILLGPRRDYAPGGGHAILPNNLAFTLTGAGLLWFGWFGFNAGSAVAVENPVSGFTAGLAFTTTQVAAAGAALTWMIVERVHHKKATSVGFASGIVAGLVAITPCAGHVVPINGMLIGAIASVVCYCAVQLKNRTKIDDSLDAFAVHGIGGIVGALLVGVFCFQPVAGALQGNWAQLGVQALGVGVSIAWCGVGTLVIATIVKLTVGLRVSEQQEKDGLDIAIHGERGYHLDQI